jgi:leader peptidase (prepilin peptidase)/N-methyltransferase
MCPVRYTRELARCPEFAILEYIMLAITSIIFSLPMRFFIGLAVGSFLNVLAMRYDPEKSVFGLGSFTGRSRCNACMRTLSWYELVPLVSFIALRAKCRTCRSPLSFQYPIMELITGILFAFVPSRIETIIMQTPSIGLAHSSAIPVFSVLWLAVSAALICIAVIDFHHKIIPDELNIFIAVAGICYVAAQYYFDAFGPVQGSLLGRYSLILSWRANVFLNHGLAALVGLSFFGAIILFSRGLAMGMGDMKLAAALGLFMGWPDGLFALAFSFVFGSLVSIVLLLRRAKGLKDAVPFGPFIVAGVFGVLFFGQAVLETYMGAFSF